MTTANDQLADLAAKTASHLTGRAQRSGFMPSMEEVDRTIAFMARSRKMDLIGPEHDVVEARAWATLNTFETESAL